MDPALLLLTLIVFVPALAAIAVAFLPSEKPEMLRYVTLLATAVTFGLTVFGFFFVSETTFDASLGVMQSTFNVDWIPTFNIYYFMGVDGISFPLVMLTAFVSFLAMLASWSITKQVKGYCILFLLLETGMLGVFLALDFFLFYVFWEVMLLPMYFLIGIWGGPRREYAAIKFFLYTLVGSVLMLIAILMLYFQSDLVKLARISDLSGDADARVTWSELHVHPDVTGRIQAILAKEQDRAPDQQAAHLEEIHTFNMLALAAMGQNSDLTDANGESIFFSPTWQKWAFMLLLIGFLIKVPSVPLHTWLPDAHVEAPTPISMILAGVLLKMGGYGIIRICYPICPEGGYHFALLVCLIGVVSMVYGAFAALAQTDFKRLVAYSSVSHMGYVVLGLGVWSATRDNVYETSYWSMGVQGAMFQMIAHGISSSGMFFMVGVLYDRVHHRDLNQFGGLHDRMPFYTALAFGIFFAGLGLPGLCGFWGEVFVVLSVWKYSYAIAIIAATVVILTAGYILWCLQRVYLGPEYKGPHGDHLYPMNFREALVGVTLLIFAVLLGVFPYQTVLQYMTKTVDRQTQQLTEWTMRHEGWTEASGQQTADAQPSRLR